MQHLSVHLWAQLADSGEDGHLPTQCQEKPLPRQWTSWKQAFLFSKHRWQRTSLMWTIDASTPLCEGCFSVVMAITTKYQNKLDLEASPRMALLQRATPRCSKPWNTGNHRALTLLPPRTILLLFLLYLSYELRGQLSSISSKSNCLLYHCWQN